MTGVLRRAVGRAIDVRDEEIAALVWSSAYFFSVLCAYYILRPIRDQMGVAGGVDNLAWLFSGTLAGMLLLHPLYTSLVSRYTRSRFVAYTYRFFILNLVAFYLVFNVAGEAQTVWVGRIFFIWVSVFNLFVVSVFWSFMTDLYRPGQSKRLFGVLAVGGTIGAMSGSSITSFLVGPLGPINLLLVSAVLLEVAAWTCRRLDREEPMLARVAGEEGEAGPGAPARAVRKSEEVIGGGVTEGVRHVLASPYLLGIAVLMLLFTITSTFLYFQRADIIGRAFPDEEAQTRVFANIDLAVNALTLVTQLFLTGRLLKWLGVGASLAILPLVSVIGFGILGVAPVLAGVVLLDIVRRAGNFAIQRPSREVLYTILPRADKYKSKNFNDTFVYRVGDQVGAWGYTALGWLGLGVSGLSFTMVPISAAWLGLALWLGRRYKAQQAGEQPPAARPRPREASGV